MLQGDSRLLVLNNHSTISGLAAFKPRQVLLAEQQKRLKMPKTRVLEDDHNLALLHSVVKYISTKVCKKTLKKIVKETQVEDGAWEANSIDLEEIYYKYLENSKNGDPSSKDLKEPEKSAKGTMLKDTDGDEGVSLDALSKKKHKKIDGSGDITKSSVSEVKSGNAVEELKEKKKKKKNAAGDEEAPVEGEGENTKKSNEENNKNDLKPKTKKKSKLTSDENGTEEVSLLAVSEKQVVPIEVPDVAKITADQNNSEPKEKKKKKKKVSEKPLDNGVEVVNKEQSQDTLDNETNSKVKKRKRSTSDDIEDKQIEAEVTEEFKRRKIEAVNVQQTEVKTFVGESNVDLKSPYPSSEKKKTVKIQQNGSVEPKTVNAFQRVKVDTVKYADERLTDNSYWAKDGAETGYGAKAQEILGQVKGRDFRHEKTKKKRGSYRGGQIDLQSHSVKFNYSDEE